MIRAVHISQKCSGDASELRAAVIGWEPPGHQVTWWEYKAGGTEGLRSESTEKAESSVPPWGFWFCCLCSPWLRTKGVHMPPCRWLEVQVGRWVVAGVPGADSYGTRVLRGFIWLITDHQALITDQWWAITAWWPVITDHCTLIADHWVPITDPWALTIEQIPGLIILLLLYRLQLLS